ncbi:MAG: bifunctional acetate--CoA ligase family protein/GNAT family N-acetyltransferase, partial [Vicinamibacteria bacterium]|nr:bifunctional acetate--CoA ligase family protein/GNAT family N-acetyltransferase [Vicinamibacteria bacterium]
MEQTTDRPLSTTCESLHFDRRALDAIFAPRNVALVGATEKEGSVGRTILWNLITSPFGGAVFPINPKRQNVMGIKAYPSIKTVPDPVDLAIIVTPAASIPGIIGECVEAGVRAAIVISAGFKEVGAAGAQLEQDILSQIRKTKMRVIGPNCLGVMSPLSGLNATFAKGMARPGNVGFISQSGALCTAVLDWSLRENVGFSAFVSIGSMLDVDWGDLIDYLGDDPRTQSIVIYMESIGNARSFLSAAREVAFTKPILVIKPGRTEGASKAAASHTGSLTGSDEVLDAAFRRSGVLRVDSIAELFHMAHVLAKQPRPKGPRLMILTNAGGPGVLATDALLLSGGELAPVAPETMEALNKVLPTQWSHNNPIDVIGDASPERYAKAVEIVAKDPNADGMLVILTPQDMTDPTQTAEQIKPLATNAGKPVLASWMGGPDIEAGEAILNRANVPTFPYPDDAAQAFNYMWQFSTNLKSLYETPVLPASIDKESTRARAGELIEGVLGAGRCLFTEAESKQLLSIYGIPTVETHISAKEEDAVAAARAIGFPIVLKLYSETITHKTDVGGVKLNLKDEAAVRAAYNDIQTAVTAKKGAKHFQGVTVQPMISAEGYELIIGSSVDPQFGPVLLFGTGGQLVEVFKDRALGLPPLNTTLARRMMERTKIYHALKGVRGRKPVDLAALEQLLVKFSEMIAEQPWIKEVDINPLLASSDRLIALDARVVLYEPGTDAAKLSRLSIRPYPSQYISRWTMKGGTPVTFRPIRPEDEPLMVKFHEMLSERSVLLRYMHPLQLSQRVAHERLARICFTDYDREIAMVVEQTAADKVSREILAVGRLNKSRDNEDGEFTMVVADPYQGRGLGDEILKHLVAIAREEKLLRLHGHLSADNDRMRALCTKMGFSLKPCEDNKT